MIAEDLDAFLDTDDFAVPGTIGASTVNGIFDNGYAAALQFAAGTKPTFLCKTADLPTVTLGTTTITINGTSYVIQEREPDGYGLETLVLEG